MKNFKKIGMIMLSLMLAFTIVSPVISQAASVSSETELDETIKKFKKKIKINYNTYKKKTEKALRKNKKKAAKQINKDEKQLEKEAKLISKEIKATKKDIKTINKNIEKISGSENEEEINLIYTYRDQLEWTTEYLYYLEELSDMNQNMLDYIDGLRFVGTI